LGQEESKVHSEAEESTSRAPDKAMNLLATAALGIWCER